MPVLVALAPPEVLQAAPELVRQLDATNFLAARGLGFGSELLDDAAERGLEAFGELFVFAPFTGKDEGKCAGRASSASEADPAERKPSVPLGCTDWAGPSMGTIEASGLAV